MFWDIIKARLKFNPSKFKDIKVLPDGGFEVKKGSLFKNKEESLNLLIKLNNSVKKLKKMNLSDIDKLRKGGNTIINTKEFLKLKEEHKEMLELLQDIYDSKDNRFLLEYDDIKELLDRVLIK